MMSLSELAERCENAAEPSAELDCAISLALVIPPEGCKAVASQMSSQAGLILDRVGRIHGTVDYQPFTFSIDAALALVPDEMAWQIDSDGPTYPASASIGQHPTGGELFNPRWTAGGETPALALCAAALKARAASGIETRQSQDGETRLGPKDESPTAESGDAQRPPQ